MRTQAQTASASGSAARPIAALFGLVRRRRRRGRDLAELAALDSGRLPDIGLSEAGRARILSRR